MKYREAAVLLPFLEGIQTIAQNSGTIDGECPDVMLRFCSGSPWITDPTVWVHTQPINGESFCGYISLQPRALLMQITEQRLYRSIMARRTVYADSSSPQYTGGIIECGVKWDKFVGLIDWLSDTTNIYTIGVSFQPGGDIETGMGDHLHIAIDGVDREEEIEIKAYEFIDIGHPEFEFSHEYVYDVTTPGEYWGADTLRKYIDQRGREDVRLMDGAICRCYRTEHGPPWVMVTRLGADSDRECAIRVTSPHVAFYHMYQHKRDK